MHKSSYEKMKMFVNNHLNQFEDRHIKILDIGSMDVNGSYKSLFQKSKWEYTGCDLEQGKNVDVVLSQPYYWGDIESQSYDVVVSGQVFEHIEYFWITIMEICRVTKEEGYICIIAPSSGHEHRYPVDCWRFYRDGFSALAKYANLKLIDAYTDWNDTGWKDSVLICKKNKNSQNIYKYKNAISKLLIDDKALLKYSDIIDNIIELEKIKTYHQFIPSNIDSFFYKYYQTDRIGNSKAHLMQIDSGGVLRRGIFVHGGSEVKISLSQQKSYTLVFKCFINKNVIDKIDTLVYKILSNTGRKDKLLFELSSSNLDFNSNQDHEIICSGEIILKVECEKSNYAWSGFEIIDFHEL